MRTFGVGRKTKWGHYLAQKRDIPALKEWNEQNYPNVERPRVRGDCLTGGINEERPCPFVGCRYHLFMEVSERRIGMNFASVDALLTMEETCALDVADKYFWGVTDVMIARFTNKTRQLINFVELKALKKVRRYFEAKEAIGGKRSGRGSKATGDKSKAA